MSAGDTDNVPSTKQENDSSEIAAADNAWLKTLGSGLGGWMSNVGGYASSLSDKLKTAVQSNSVLNEFQEEQKKFEREQQRVHDTAVPPWVGYNEEESIKAQILELSADSRTVLRQPPPGVQFHFDFKKSFPVAQAILKEDKRLQNLRFDLVPKKILEERFWHNYFYRVFLVKQSTQLATLASSEHKSTITQGDSGKPEDVHAYTPSASSLELPATCEKHSPVDDFASDALTTSTEHQVIDRYSIANELEQLGVAAGDLEVAEDWDEDLARELEDLGLENEVEGTNIESDQQWEEEIERILDKHSDN